jgi:hypothetical protein
VSRGRRAIGPTPNLREEPGVAPGSSAIPAARRAALAALAALLLSAVAAASVSAHGGAPILEVVPSSVAAGDSVTVYGDDLSPDVAGTFHLLTARGELPVARADIASDGHLTVAMQVPGDLPPRIYELRMTDDLGIQISTFITVEDQTAADDGSLLRLVVAIAGAAIAIGVLIWALRSRARPRLSA